MVNRKSTEGSKLDGSRTYKTAGPAQAGPAVSNPMKDSVSVAVAATAAATITAAVSRAIGLRLGFADIDRASVHGRLVLVCDRGLGLIGIDVHESKASSLDDTGLSGAIFGELVHEGGFGNRIRQIADVK